MQHHDTITGTSPDDVVQNYLEEISQGIEKVMPSYSKMAFSLFAGDNNIDATWCSQTNSTFDHCPVFDDIGS
jgi:hypothetical protein